MLIYKIAYADDWLEELQSDTYQGTAKDKEDGFIHFSTGEQLIETLKLHYRDAKRPLAICAVDAEALGENLKWEPSRNGDLFPHLYALLPRSAVGRTVIGFYFPFADDGFAMIRDFTAGTGTFADPEPDPEA